MERWRRGGKDDKEEMKKERRKMSGQCPISLLLEPLPVYIECLEKRSEEDEEKDGERGKRKKIKLKKGDKKCDRKRAGLIASTTSTAWF